MPNLNSRNDSRSRGQKHRWGLQSLSSFAIKRVDLVQGISIAEKDIVDLL
jgi:hypothetical protein